MIIDGSTYQRLAHAARSNPRELREHEIEESKHNRESIEVRLLLSLLLLTFFFITRSQDELERRKKAIQQYDQQRKKNAPLDDIDQEAKEEAEYMLKRANELRQEQEDEVKHLNEVSLFSLLSSPTLVLS